MSKIFCNHLPIGHPQTFHIRWQSADTFIRENGAKKLEARIFNLKGTYRKTTTKKKAK